MWLHRLMLQTPGVEDIDKSRSEFSVQKISRAIVGMHNGSFLLISDTKMFSKRWPTPIFEAQFLKICFCFDWDDPECSTNTVS